MRDPKEIAYKIFDDLLAGEKIQIAMFAPNKPELFIQFGKDYIDNGGDLMFSCDYKWIYKVRSMADILALSESKINNSYKK